MRVFYGKKGPKKQSKAKQQQQHHHHTSNHVDAKEAKVVCSIFISNFHDKVAVLRNSDALGAKQFFLSRSYVYHNVKIHYVYTSP